MKGSSELKFQVILSMLLYTIICPSFRYNDDIFADYITELPDIHRYMYITGVYLSQIMDQLVNQSIITVNCNWSVGCNSIETIS